MTDSFVSDQDNNKGTTSFTPEGSQDNGTSAVDQLGNKLQQQIDVMQKRMGDKDTHITGIESENQTLREKLADIEEKVQSMGTVEDALTRMREAQDSNQDTTLDEDMLVSKVLGKMETRTLEEKREANFIEVATKLTNMYGADKVDSLIDKVALENGLTRSDVADLAKKAPQAVYKMLGIGHTATTAVPTHSTHVGFTNESQNKDQKLADFAKMRKENPADFYKPAVQKQFRELCLS